MKAAMLKNMSGTSLEMKGQRTGWCAFQTNFLQLFQCVQDIFFHVSSDTVTVSWNISSLL